MCSHYRPDGPSKSIPKPRNGRPETVYVYVPEGFDPSDYLPEDLSDCFDGARYFVHTLIQCVAFEKRNANGFALILADLMRKFFPRNKYVPARDAMVAKGVMDCDNQYIKKVKPLGYRLSDELASRRIMPVAIQDQRVANLIRKSREAALFTPEGGVHRHLLNCIMKLDIDYPAALDCLLSGDFEQGDEIGIASIRDGQWRFKPDDYGRVHSNLTNLRSKLRCFLSYRGRPLLNLDVKNSQPLFFARVLMNRFPEGQRPADVSSYINLVQDGQFYERLMEITGRTKESRSAFKTQFFYILYGENKSQSPIARAFIKAFPNVYAVIREEKAETYEALAHKLQRLESDLMIGRVAFRCRGELPKAFIGTIHDSIMTTEKYAKSVRRIMREEFAAINLRVEIKVERQVRPPALV